LIDSSADLLIYGMGEHQIIDVAEALDSGININDITYIRGTVFKTKDKSLAYDYIELPKFVESKNSKVEYGKAFKIQYDNTDAITAKSLLEEYEGLYVIQNPPSYPLTVQEMDDVYDLEYEMKYHPSYEELGGVPALKEIKFSLTSNRGCFGSCSFCALNFHQGRVLQTRSQDSIVKEAEKMIEDPEFKGYIHDVGGPTANFRYKSCKKQEEYGVCKDKQCLFPTKCKNLVVNHTDYVALLKRLRELPNVKKVFVRSGVRFDYVMYDKNKKFLEDLVKYHVSGQLRTAPEHVSNDVLKYMGKPSIEVYNSFVEEFYRINDKLGMKQFVVPYLISSHPGSRLKDAIMLAEYIRDMGYMPEQVSDFYPTPGTLSTCMYYTGIDPRTGESVYIPKTREEKQMQKALIQYRKRENYNLVLKALQKAGRYDLIGYGENCLVRPPKHDNNNRRIDYGKKKKK